jgi:hypothetical protein
VTAVRERPSNEDANRAGGPTDLPGVRNISGLQVSHAEPLAATADEAEMATTRITVTGSSTER